MKSNKREVAKRLRQRQADLLNAIQRNVEDRQVCDSQAEILYKGNPEVQRWVSLRNAAENATRRYKELSDELTSATLALLSLK